MKGDFFFIYLQMMAKMWEIRRKEMHIQSEGEKKLKKVKTRFFNTSYFQWKSTQEQANHMRVWTVQKTHFYTREKSWILSALFIHSGHIEKSLKICEAGKEILQIGYIALKQSQLKG